jgi:hypothetical protein
MATKVSLKHSVKVKGKTYRLRTNKSFFPVYQEETIRATGPQMRNLAFGSYNLLVEKILAGDDDGLPKRIQISDLPFYDSRFKGIAKRKPFSFPPLNPDYVDRKAIEDLDPRPLIATGFYVENIQVTEEESPEGILYSVYVPDIKHPSGVTLPTLVGWLEYGTQNMPARPHWRPVALIVRQRWERLPKNIEVEALRKALKRLK